MNRRTLLRVAVCGGLLSVSGCVASIKCGIDGNYDHLTLTEVPSYVNQYSERVIIHFDELSDAEQGVVNKAVSRGSFKQCHAFKGEPNGVMRLRERVSRRWETSGIDGETAIEHTYLERDGNYYGIHLIILDTFVVDSIPLECDEDGCHAVTPTPP